MTRKDEVVKWLNTLNKSYRDSCAKRADVPARWVQAVKDGQISNPGSDRIDRLHSVMVLSSCVAPVKTLTSEEISKLYPRMVEDRT